jgi:multidrug efflux pump subunit AcrB/outer membrane protein TolC
MSSTTLAIRGYRFVIVATLAALVLGGLGYVKMPRQEDPTLPAFGGTVTVQYPTATTEEIETRVIEPIERAIHELQEIDLVESTAADGVAVITGEFRDDVDKDEAYDLFVQKVSGVLGELPPEVIDVRMIEQKPSAVVVMQVALHGSAATDAELHHWAEELESRWRTLADVGEVRVEGAQQPEVHVVVDPDRLAASGLTLGRVSDVLASTNAEIPGGTALTGPRRLSIRPNPRLQDLDDIRNTVLSAVDGRPVRLGDLATVSWQTQSPRYRVRHQGEAAVLVTAQLKEGRNVFGLTKAAREELDRFESVLPAHVTATVVLDQSDDVRARLRTFGSSLVQGGLIIVLFVALMIGWRAALVAISAMLMAIGISFGLLEWFGVSLQQMSIAGLVVVLGLLVDNAVVVFESILHERQKGADAVRAAIVGTDRVARAVVSATATTVAAFVPMLFMAGTVGDFTRDIPTVVSLVLIVSLGVALFVTPLLATRLFASPAAAQPAGLQPYLDRIARTGPYARTLDFVQARPRTTIAAMLTIALACLALAPLLGMNFFPRADDKPQFLVRLKTPQGTNLHTTQERAIEVERWVMEQGMARSVTTNIGRGNPMIYYNTLRDFQQPHFAELLVMVERDNSIRIPDYARAIRERFADDPRLVVETKLLVQGPPVGLPVSIRLKGRDLERLSAHADELAGALRGIEGAINVTHDLVPGAPRLELLTDPVLVHKLGLDPAMVAREVRLAMAGGTATTLRIDDDDRDVIVRLAASGDERIGDLERVHLPMGPDGNVPLAQLTRPTLTGTYARIMHTDLERSVIVGADLDGRLATDVVAELLPHVRALPLDATESWQVIGEDEDRDRAFLSMLQNVVVAMGLIYGILVLQFASFKQPLVIFASIPVALAGSVIGLLVGGWPFGFTAFVGLLALVGIVVNDSIVLVDRINQYRKEGETLEHAVRHAAQSRLQPILLTTLTTQAGLLPLTFFGGSMWGPMGWVIIGGLTASTLVTLVLVPAMVLVIERGGSSQTRTADGIPARPALGAALIALLLVGAPLAPARAQDPLTLPEVLARIDAASPDLHAALAEIDAAHADLRRARSSWWPRVQASVDLVRTDDPSTTFGIQLREVTGPEDLLSFDPDAYVDLASAAISVDWLLWDFSRSALIRAATEGERAREAAAEAARQRLRLAATALYFEVVQAREQMRVQEATRVLVERELDDAKMRAGAGRTLEADVLGLRARLAQVDVALAQAEGNHRIARARLAELLDLDENALGEPDPQTIVPSLEEPLEWIRIRAREQRPEVIAAARAQLAEVGRIDAASGERWPRLVASGRLESLVPEFESERASSSRLAAVGLRWSPWRGGEIGAEIDRARAGARRAEAQLIAAEREVEREAIAAWTQRQTAERQLEAATLGHEAADEAYRIVALRYREGRETLTRLIEAERALTEARTQQTRARAAVQIATAQLRWTAVLPVLP